MPYKDQAKRLEYSIEYEAARKGKRGPYSKIRYEANRDEILARCKIAYALCKPINRLIKGRKAERQIGRRYSKLKAHAKDRKITFDLNEKQYVFLTSGGLCIYCGQSLPPVGGGLDRKNSYLGYSAENCVPCCKVCNRIRGKDDISYSDMFEVVKLLRKLRTKADAGDDSEEYF
jgi:5-methylcytosine-specific restriction endonuclease McrA